MRKSFVDDTSLFSKFLDINKSITELNTDVEKISKWANQWEMQFNLDPNKQANEIIFSRKLVSNNLPRPLLNLRIIILLDVLIKKIWELSSNFNFNTHIDQKIKKCNKMIGLTRRTFSKSSSQCFTYNI